MDNTPLNPKECVRLYMDYGSYTFHLVVYHYEKHEDYEMCGKVLKIMRKAEDYLGFPYSSIRPDSWEEDYTSQFEAFGLTGEIAVKKMGHYCSGLIKEIKGHNTA